MKRFIALALAVTILSVLMVTPATAQPTIYMQQIFTSYTGLKDTARYTAARKVDANFMKSVTMVGYSSNGTQITTTPGGTFAMQCSHSSSGPWVNCKDVAANAINTTTPATYTMNNLYTWVRGAWTRTSDSLYKISAYLLYSD